ncbi:glycosyltransferase family 4 protein [Pseudoalteromonas rubra]|nr:glycosyltransferase family 4 protein [Pseudoalteromonas rubra]
MKVCHLTSAHPRDDTRIFVKMCLSCVEQGWDTALIVADNFGDEIKDGVNIYDVGFNSNSRLKRFTQIVWSVYKKAIDLNADIYHLHDPELLSIALLLKLKGKKVIFDAHEDLPKQILSKPYLKPYQAKVISFLAKNFERFVCKKLDGVVAATPFIKEKFQVYGCNSEAVNNFPKLEEFSEVKVKKESKVFSACYIGNISKVRGIIEMLDALQASKDIPLSIAGKFNDPILEQKANAHPAWDKVEDHGWLDRHAVSDLMANSSVGLVTLHPIINYQDALPVKMFEYMAAGIPLIATDIPYWKQIIERSECGLVVDPFNPEEYAEKLKYLQSNPDLCAKMGENGKKAIEMEYNWTIEKRKLASFYARIVN